MKQAVLCSSPFVFGTGPAICFNSEPLVQPVVTSG